MRRDPPKYDAPGIKELIPSIQGLRRQGATDEEIAKALRIGKRTLIRLRREFPEFDRAMREGYEISSGILLNTAFKQAVGYKEPVTEAQKVKTQRYDSDSQKVLTDEALETVTYEKTVPPSERMMKFLLMNRFPDLFKERQEGEADSAVRVVFKGMDDSEAEEMSG